MALGNVLPVFMWKYFFLEYVDLAITGILWYWDMSPILTFLKKKKKKIFFCEQNFILTNVNTCGGTKLKQRNISLSIEWFKEIRHLKTVDYGRKCAHTKMYCTPECIEYPKFRDPCDLFYVLEFLFRHQNHTSFFIDHTFCHFRIIRTTVIVII